MKVPKYLDLEWFSQQGFNFPNLLEVQGLAKLLRMKETFNIKLVKVFYTYAHVDLERNLFYIVNGVDMVADVSMWKEVAGLDMGGVHKFDETTDGYNKMQTYRGMLLDSVPRSDQKHFNQLNQESN